MAGNGENIDTPHEETPHRPGKEPMSSRRPSNSQCKRTTRSRTTQPEGGPSTRTTRSRRTQPEGGPSTQTTRSRRTQPEGGPSIRSTRSRRTQHGNGQNPRVRDEEPNLGGAQPMDYGSYDPTRAAQGNNTQNQPDLGVRRPRGRPRGSRTRRHETTQEDPQNAQEEQLGEIEGPPNNEQPEETEVPPKNPNDQPEPSHRNENRRRSKTRE
ncbi:hypothetical protein CsatB_017571 [Cannabis sativa]|uniref:uncharacterized protein LOC115710584 n=1 Tax=Cannabis sativa TaxID=3483 RepID=UPI0029CA69CC|nr:uncharacterized protein LOC115710584 [Cannabis sativa]